jgi:hypothetical protein
LEGSFEGNAGVLVLPEGATRMDKEDFEGSFACPSSSTVIPIGVNFGELKGLAGKSRSKKGKFERQAVITNGDRLLTKPYICLV